MLGLLGVQTRNIDDTGDPMLLRRSRAIFAKLTQPLAALTRVGDRFP